ncbi:MAG: sugar MFS transporter [bacterium]|nr:sugar MFS transporter [bacterium]
MKRNYFIVFLVFLIFFVISFLTNIMGPLVPEIIEGFDLSLFMAGFLPFSFFLAYGVMSIPAGMLIEKFKEKPVIVASWVLAFGGSLLFALFSSYGVVLAASFMIGIGMAMLQVAINPLLRVAGGEEHFAFNSVMAQMIFGLASFISPQVYSYLVKNLDGYTGGGNFFIDTLSKIVPTNLPWVSLYWVFVIVSLAMVLFCALIRLPKVELKEDEKAGAWETHVELFKNKFVILYFIGIFCYVGTEQGVANWISKFLETYHNLDPQTVGADVVGNFWLFLTIGCLISLGLLKLFDSRKLLSLFSLLAMLSLTVALLSSGKVAIWAFPMVGFFASLMWSAIFSLALNSVKSHHGSFSGILCTGIMGGAILPPVIGYLGDLIGLRLGMMFLYLTLAYIMSIGFWAKPLINNATIFNKDKAEA